MRGPQPAKTSEFGMPCTSRLDRRSPASSAGTSVTFLGWFSTGRVLFCNQLAMRRPHRVFIVTREREHGVRPCKHSTCVNRHINEKVR